MQNKRNLRFLTVTKTQKAGRSRSGLQSFFHKGGGVKQKWRIVDYFRSLKNVPAVVKSIDYDPSRSAPLALLAYKNEILSYIIAPKNLSIGQIIYSCDEISLGNIHHFQPGSAHYLDKFPIGTFLYNIHLSVSSLKGAQFVRSSGASAQVLRKSTHFVILKLKSGEHRKFFGSTVATLGIPDRVAYSLRSRKAGTSRKIGIRPTVRGCAMNPIDHPQGGGAAKSSGKRGAFSPWGKFSKGTKTAQPKSRSKFIIKLRHEK
jgi:large subunit ribosomal protein L2